MNENPDRSTAVVGWKTITVLLATGAGTVLILIAILLTLLPWIGAGWPERFSLMAVFLGLVGTGMVLAGPSRLPPPPAYLGALELLKGIWGAGTAWIGPTLVVALAGFGPAATPLVSGLLRWGLALTLLFPFGILCGLSLAAAFFRLCDRPEAAAQMAVLSGGTILAGGSAGLAVGTFLLLPAAGIPAALTGGVILTFAAAAGWTLWGRSRGAGAVTPEPAARVVKAADRIAVLMAGIAVGAAVPPSIRLLALLFGPTWKTGLSAGLILILGLAGAWVRIGPPRRRGTGRDRLPAVAFLMASVGLLGAVFLFEPLAGLTARAFQAPDPVFPLVRLLYSAAFLFPVSVAAALIVTSILNRCLADGMPRTRIHILPATALFGAAAGLPASSWILIPAGGLRFSFMFLVILTLAAGAALWLRAPAAGRIGRLAVPAVSVVAVLAASALSPPWSPGILTAGIYRYAATISSEFPTAGGFLQLRRTAPPLRFWEGRSGTVSIERATEPGREGLYLTIDGTVEESWSARMIGPALVGHTGLLLRPPSPAPPDVMLIGYGAGITARSILRHDVGSLTILEGEPAVLAASSEFTEMSGPVLDDERVSVVRSDPRGYWALSSRRFDVVMSRGADPWLLRGGLMHSREFFEQCRRHLRPGGLQVHRVPLSATTGFALAAVMRAFLEVYPDVIAIEMTNWDFLLIGSEAPWRIPLEEFQRRFRTPAVREDLGNLGVPAPASILGRFVAGGDDLRLFTSAVPALTDGRLATLDLPRNFSKRNLQVLRQRLNASGTRIVPYLDPFEDPAEQGEFLYRLAKTLLLRGASGLVTEIAGEIERLGFDSRATWLRGQLAFQVDDRERAFALWEGILERDPENLDSLMSLGGYYQDFGLYHAAEPYLAALEKAYPDRALALFSHGKNLFFLLQDEAAERSLGKLVDMGGTDLYPEALYYLGVIAKRNARTEEAADYLTRFLGRSYASGELGLMAAQAHLDLAEVYRRMDKTDLAEQHQEAARRLTEGLRQLSETGPGGS